MTIFEWFFYRINNWKLNKNPTEKCFVHNGLKLTNYLGSALKIGNLLFIKLKYKTFYFSVPDKLFFSWFVYYILAWTSFQIFYIMYCLFLILFNLKVVINHLRIFIQRILYKQVNLSYFLIFLVNRNLSDELSGIRYNVNNYPKCSNSYWFHCHCNASQNFLVRSSLWCI